MNEITVIVIPAPDDNGISEVPYIKRVKNSYKSFKSLLNDCYFDIVCLAQFPNDRMMDAYVDDEGKLKGLNANHVFHDFAITKLKMKPCYTLDGTVILSLTNNEGENVDFMVNEAENLLHDLIECHERVQGKPLAATEPEMHFYSFD